MFALMLESLVLKLFPRGSDDAVSLKYFLFLNFNWTVLVIVKSCHNPSTIPKSESNSKVQV